MLIVKRVIALPAATYW